MTASSHDATPIGAITNRLFGGNADRATRKRWAMGDSPRTEQPVWRNSYYVGTKEHRIWRPILDGSVRQGKRWTAALLAAAKEMEAKTLADRQEEEPGSRNGALGDIGLQVLEYLLNLVDFQTGRLEPAIATIAASVRKSYSAVHRALCRLREHGFLCWMRRSRKIEDAEPGERQVEQHSSAYAPLVPDWLRDRFGRMFGKAQLPACEVDRLSAQDEEFKRMRESLSCSEYVQDFARVHDAKQGGILSRIAKALDARDAVTEAPPRLVRSG